MEESKEELEKLKKDIMKEKQRYLMVAMERESQLQKQIELLETKRQELEQLKKEQAETAAKAAAASDQVEAEHQAQTAFGGKPSAETTAPAQPVQPAQVAQTEADAANQDLLDQQKKLISQQYGILTLLNGVLNNLITKDKDTVIQAMKNYGMNDAQIKKLEAYIMSHQSKRATASKAE
jgi:hypothetical protein